MSSFSNKHVTLWFGGKMFGGNPVLSIKFILVSLIATMMVLVIYKGSLKNILSQRFGSRCPLAFTIFHHPIMILDMTFQIIVPSARNLEHLMPLMHLFTLLINTTSKNYFGRCFQSYLNRTPLVHRSQRGFQKRLVSLLENVPTTGHLPLEGLLGVIFQT